LAASSRCTAGIIELEAGFDFGQGLGVALDIEANVVGLRKLLDHVGHLATTPVFHAMYFSAARGNDTLVTLDHRGHLLALVGMDNKYYFIVTHANSLWTD
jgi:hypothetical protein